MLEYDIFITPENHYIVLDLKHRNKNHAQAAIEGTRAYITTLKNLGSITSAVFKELIKELNEIEKYLQKEIKFAEKEKELKDIKNEDQIFLRKLPKGAKSLEKITESDLTIKTKENLKKLSEKYNIPWTEYYRYSINQGITDVFGHITNCTAKIAHGYIIVNDRKDINYFRLETKNRSAGQTNIYYNNKVVQMTTLLIDNKNIHANTKNNFKEFNNRKES